MHTYDEPSGNITVDCAETTTFAVLNFWLHVPMIDLYFVGRRTWSRSMSWGEMTSPWEKKWMLQLEKPDLSILQQYYIFFVH